MEEPLIRFGDVEIDPRTREVRRGGQPVPVQKKVYDLLLYLVAHRDRAVGKDELQERVWPGMIVTETALTRAVMKARRAVGDDSERQHVIRTVHGHGYRFIAVLDETPGPVMAGEEESPAETSGASPRPVATWSVVAAVALLALIAVAALLTVTPGGSVGSRIAVLPLQDETGDPELSWTGLGLMSYVNRLLAEGSGGETVPARRMMAAVESLPADPSDPALQEFRKSLGASHLLHGTLRRSGDRLSLEYRVVHAQGASPPASVSGEDPTALAREMARAVIGSLPGAGLRRDFRTVSGDPFVNEAYARGLALQLQGEVAKARDYFAVAVGQAPDLFWPRYELALAMRDMGELGAALGNLEELARRADRDGDPDMQSAAYNALAQVHWRQRAYDLADAAYGKAQEAARRSGDPAREAIVLTNRGILARVSGDLEGARRFLAAALDATEKTERPERASIYQSLGQVEWAAGELPLAMDYYRRARDEFRVEGNRRGMAASLNSMARVERRQGRYGEAETHMLQARDVRESLGGYFGRVSSELSLAQLYGEMERWEAAMSHADAALELARENGNRADAADALRTRATIALQRGDMVRASRDLARLESEYPEHREEPLQSLLSARLAMLEGRPEDGRSLARAAMENDSPAVRIDALDTLAVGADDMASARQYWEQALAIARENHERGRVGRILLDMARRELAEGNLEAARASAAILLADYGEWDGVADLRERLAQADTPE